MSILKKLAVALVVVVLVLGVAAWWIIRGNPADYTVAQVTGGYVGLILTLWIVCGLVNLCGALAMAELSAMFPQAGGNYVFLRETYGRCWAFMWAWAEFWVIRTGSIAALATCGCVSMSDQPTIPSSVVILISETKRTPCASCASAGSV